ncbi:hypothetical protein BLOT_006215 [Blomia tropicalis]|nr:hypothetical protein BLOT_006215 [Blomia tropicalis]
MKTFIIFEVCIMPRLVICTLLIYLNLIKDIIAPIINLRDEFDGLDLKSIDIDYFNDDYNKSKPNEMLMDLKCMKLISEIMFQL